MKKSPDYDITVFINCPFDSQYSKLFRAAVFTIHSLGLRPLCAMNEVDAQNRLQKIMRMIGSAKYSIHDISRTELDDDNKLPRFNMPFELGLDIGCKEFATRHKDKKLLIFDIEQFRFQKFISDIAGFDPKPHHGKTKEVIRIISDWIRGELKNMELPNGKQICDDYKNFEIDFREIRKTLPSKPAFTDFSYIVADWIEKLQKKKVI